MSHRQNDIFFENQWQMFDEALESKDYSTAKGVIEHLRSFSFTDEAQELEQELLGANVTDFV